MRFRKRITLFPGVRINISGSGISTTIGPRGASVNLGRNGAFLNTGIPGTGLYNRQKIGRKNKGGGPPPPPAPATLHVIAGSELRSADVEEITSAGTQTLAEEIATCAAERQSLQQQLQKANAKLTRARVARTMARLLLVGWFIPWFNRRVAHRQEAVNEVLERLRLQVIELDTEMPDALVRSYQALHERFVQLAACRRIWDVVSEAQVDRIAMRSAAGKHVDRRPVQFSTRGIELLSCPQGCMHLHNANGGDLYIYHAFIIMRSADGRMGVIDLSELTVAAERISFTEHELVPEDAEIIGHSWLKANKDGSPDRRFRNNMSIPRCAYGEIRLRSSTGLNEAYLFSNAGAALAFAEALRAYCAQLRRNG
jgi:hypothetical protein